MTCTTIYDYYVNIILPKYRVSDFSNKKEGVGKKGFLIKKKVGIPYVGQHRREFFNIRGGSLTLRKLSTFPLAFTS